MNYNTDNETLQQESMAITGIKKLTKIVIELERKVGSLKSEHDRIASGYTISANSCLAPSHIDVSNTTIQLNKLHLENIHRLTGITAFRIPEFEGFGIRFEMFAEGKFEAPHYIILRQGNNKQLEIYRHTIPTHINLELGTDLNQFVKTVRRQLDQHQTKKLLLTNLPHVKSVESDKAMRMVSLVFDDEISQAYLLCNDMTVTKVISETPDLESMLVGPLATLKTRLELIDYGMPNR